MPDPKTPKPRAKRRNYQALNAAAINYAKASLGILATFVDEGNSPTLRANLEGQRTAYQRILVELGEDGAK